MLNVALAVLTASNSRDKAQKPRRCSTAQCRPTSISEGQHRLSASVVWPAWCVGQQGLDRWAADVLGEIHDIAHHRCAASSDVGPFGLPVRALVPRWHGGSLFGSWPLRPVPFRRGGCRGRVFRLAAPKADGMVGGRVLRGATVGRGPGDFVGAGHVRWQPHRPSRKMVRGGRRRATGPPRRRRR